jgi:hypothetical protein
MDTDDQWWHKSQSHDDDDDTEFPTCTACGGEYYDDEVLACPHCGHYLTDTAPGLQRFPRWIAWTGFVLLLWFLIYQGWFILFVNFLFR